MSRSFLPDWLLAVGQAESATAHVPKRPPRKSRLTTGHVLIPDATTTSTTTTTTTTSSTTNTTSLPGNPALAEALKRIKEEAKRATAARVTAPPSPPRRLSPPSSPDPERVVAKLIGGGLEPLDPDVPLLRDASLKRPSRAVPHSQPIKRARVRRPRASRYNDPTPTFLDSDDAAPDATSSRSSSPLLGKNFRKVTTLAQVDVVPLVSASLQAQVLSSSSSSSSPQQQHYSPQHSPQRSPFSLDIAPDLSPLQTPPPPSPPPPPPPVSIKIEFVFQPLEYESPVSISPPPSLSSSPDRRHSPTLVSLPKLDPTAPTAFDEDADEGPAFTRFDPAFLRGDYLP